MRKALICLSALALVACSPKPEKVKPVPMGDAAFSGLSCAQVRERRAVVKHEVDYLTNAQRNARRGDIVGVVLTGIQVARVAGGNVAKELAIAKGELAALDRRGCQ